MRMKPTVMARALRLYRKRPEVSKRAMAAHARAKEAHEQRVRAAFQHVSAFVRSRDVSSVVGAEAAKLWHITFERLQANPDDIGHALQPWYALPEKKPAAPVKHWAQR